MTEGVLMKRDESQIDLITDDMIPLASRRMRDGVRVSRERVFIKIPAGEKAVLCSCGEYFYWAIHPNTGKPHPVSLKHDQAVAPTATTWGEGVSHVPDCPDREIHLKVASMRRLRDRRR